MKPAFIVLLLVLAGCQTDAVSGYFVATDSVEDLPAPVAATLDAAHPGSFLLHAESSGGAWDLELARRGRHYEMEIDPEGWILRNSVDKSIAWLDRIPTQVIDAVSEAHPAWVFLDYDHDRSTGIWTVGLVDRGVEHELKIDADWMIVSDQRDED